MKFFCMQFQWMPLSSEIWVYNFIINNNVELQLPYFLSNIWRCRYVDSLFSFSFLWYWELNPRAKLVLALNCVFDFFFFWVGVRPRVLRLLGKPSTTEPYPQPRWYFHFKVFIEQEVFLSLSYCCIFSKQ